MKIEIRSMGKHGIYIAIDNFMYINSLAELLNIEPHVLKNLYKKYKSEVLHFNRGVHVFSNMIDAQNFINDLQSYIVMRNLNG